MRITTLNQIFGMLAVTATLCGTETSARSELSLSALLLRRRGNRATPVGQGPGDMMPIS